MSKLHFVTGQPRSGTTLSGHLAANGGVFYNQSFTLFFYEIVRRLSDDYYPFSPNDLLLSEDVYNMNFRKMR